MLETDRTSIERDLNVLSLEDTHIGDVSVVKCVLFSETKVGNHLHNLYTLTRKDRSECRSARG